ncbi:MAG: SAM-dependent chlorinase/fluorinase [Thermoguttaceae bacterium]|nr:SAM-dependent chlorinase/fluorinase [Thermoguttaceae bacterium]MDW8039773.1 SAM-dependent chlorinase/fluorinase [Thermoguttaceae bacterium]
MNIITLTTDFGVDSPYVAAMKGVIFSINRRAVVVDITHAISPQNIREAAIILEEVTPYYPPGTIHVVVVDPGVGTERALVYARFSGQQFLAPDNGLLSRLARQQQPEEVRRLENQRFWRHPVSKTFHGRDILAPTAAHLSLGVVPAELGPPAQLSVLLDWPEVRILPDRIVGVVEEIDSFGNLITNIRAEHLAGRPTDRRAVVVCGIYETYGIYGTYGQQPEDSLVAIISSSGRLELALVGSNAARRLGIAVGTPVTVAWE